MARFIFYVFTRDSVYIVLFTCFPEQKNFIKNYSKFVYKRNYKNHLQLTLFISIILDFIISSRLKSKVIKLLRIKLKCRNVEILFSCEYGSFRDTLLWHMTLKHHVLRTRNLNRNMLFPYFIELRNMLKQH